MLLALILTAMVFPVAAQNSNGQGSKTAPAPFVSIDSFNQCGLVTKLAPNKLDPGCFQSLQNAILDEDYTLKRRQGYAPYTSSPCSGAQSVRGLWPFYGSDGSQYLIILSSNTMFSSKGDGACTAITGLTNINSTAQMSCAQALGYLWCADGVDQPFRTNVTSTDTLTQAPLGKYIGAFRNRIVIAGVQGNLTNEYLSGELNGLDWTLPSVSYSTSPAILRLNGTNDGLPIKCVLGEFQNNFYTGRDYDLWALSGYDLRDFALRRVSEQIGCSDNNSPKEVNNVLMWLSHRGIEGLSGTSISWLSYPIDPTVSGIISAAGNSQSQGINGNDFNSGQLCASGPYSCTSTTVNPGVVVVSTWGGSNQTASDFGVDGLVSVATNSNNTVTLYQNGNGVFINAGSESCSPPGGASSNPGSNWTASSCFGPNGCWSCSGGASSNGFYGTNYWLVNQSGSSCPETMTFQITDTSNNVLVSSAVNIPTGNHVQTLTMDTSGLSIPQIKLKVSDSNFSGTLVSVPFLRPNQVVLKYNSILAGGCRGGFDMDETTSLTTSGTKFHCFDTGISTPTWGDFNATVSSDTNSALTFNTKVASNCVTTTFDSQLSPTIGQKIPNSSKEGIMYLARYTINSATNTPSALSYVAMTAATTAYYISPCIITSANTSWGTFNVDAVTNGGSFTFWMSTGTSCNQVINPASANWAQVTANSIIPLAVSSYTAIRVLFSLDIASETPTIQDMSVGWNTSSGRPPVASATYKNRYYLFYTTGTASTSVNDHAVVYDQNGHWTLFDDVNAASSALYLNSLFIGDAQNTGNVYLFDSGQADNGRSYTFSFQTPDMDAGDPIAPKQFLGAYLEIGAPNATTAGSSLACAYSLDGSSTTYSLQSVSLAESPEQAGYFVAKLPFPSANSGVPTTGHWVNLSCSATGTVGPIQVYGIRITYNPLDWQ